PVLRHARCGRHRRPDRRRHAPRGAAGAGAALPGARGARRRPVAAARPHRPAAVNLRLTLSYDGTGFRGWARQPGLRTVEGTLATALDERYPGWHGLAVAGRTDTGVHALRQVASVRVAAGPPAASAAAALNAALPDDVVILDAAEAPDPFHARHSARARSYLYRVRVARPPSALDARRALHHPGALDRAVLDAWAAALPGTHDFTAFTPT